MKGSRVLYIETIHGKKTFRSVYLDWWGYQNILSRLFKLLFIYTVPSNDSL